MLRFFLKIGGSIVPYRIDDTFQDSNNQIWKCVSWRREYESLMLGEPIIKFRNTITDECFEGTEKQVSKFIECKNNKEALPCPFCGNEDIRFDCHKSSSNPTGEVWSMRCYDCGATFPNRYKKELLLAAWNRRV